jgi:phospholipid-binding lipoprotein MlaA
MKSELKNTITTLSVLILSFVLLIGCGMPKLVEEEIPPKRPISEYVKDDVTYMVDIYDPWESMNRRIYKFNAQFDEYVFLPVVSAYEFITPDFVEDGISNFFRNIGEVQTFTNSVLQIKIGKAGTTLGRFAINTTIGILGLWDPATLMGINRQEEDFGQTLGFYGLGQGPYFVMPFLGPSSLRDGSGFVVDSVAHAVLHKQIMDETNWSDGEKSLFSYTYTLLYSIDLRHNIDFRYYESGSPFEYELVRMFYMKYREIQVEN